MKSKIKIIFYVGAFLLLMGHSFKEESIYINANECSSYLNSEEQGPFSAMEFERISPPLTMYIQGTVNIRRGPNKSYEMLGRFALNDMVEVEGKTGNNWYRFIYKGHRAYAYGSYFGENKVDLVALAALQAAQAAQLPQNNPQTTQVNVPAAQAAGVIMVGDSRCVQMQEATAGGGVAWVCENSKGYNWLIEKAMSRIDPYVGRGTKVVFCLGVNDPGNANNYVSLVNMKAAEWAGRGARTYFVSVNPVWENPYTTAEQVETFNQTVTGSLIGVKWIDTKSILEATGYRILDGLHYDTDTNIKIFNLILGGL